jgi:hypothetical protein
MLESLHLPASVTKLKSGALSDLPFLKTLSFEPECWLQRIKTGVFRGCHSLESICLPARVKILSNGCFADLPMLSSLTFESGSKLQIIGDEAFARSILLHSIVLPKSVCDIAVSSFAGSSIEKIAFDGANANYYVSGPCLIAIEGMKLIRYFGSAVDVILPADCPPDNDSKIVLKTDMRLIQIERFTFEKNSILKTISIPASVEILGKGCFEECTSLWQVTFESSSRLTRIGDCAFQKCSSLTSICIPSEVEEIPNYCFSGCHSLTNMFLERGSKLVRILGGAFQNCRSLRSLFIPSQLEIIGFGALLGCESVREMIFETPSRLKQLELPRSEFGTLFIPDSVEIVCGSIGNLASHSRVLHFSQRSSLNSINLRGFTDFFAMMGDGDAGTSAFLRLSHNILRRFRCMHERL